MKSKNTKNTEITKNSTKAKRRPAKEAVAARRIVRQRTPNQGSETNPRKVVIRMTERMSNELASIQGLIYAYGKRETLSTIWQRVLMPCLREYVKPYAAKAKAARLRGGRRAK